MNDDELRETVCSDYQHIGPGDDATRRALADLLMEMRVAGYATLISPHQTIRVYDVVRGQIADRDVRVSADRQLAAIRAAWNDIREYWGSGATVNLDNTT